MRPVVPVSELAPQHRASERRVARRRVVGTHRSPACPSRTSGNARHRAARTTHPSPPARSRPPSHFTAPSAISPRHQRGRRPVGHPQQLLRDDQSWLVYTDWATTGYQGQRPIASHRAAGLGSRSQTLRWEPRFSRPDRKRPYPTGPEGPYPKRHRQADRASGDDQASDGAEEVSTPAPLRAAPPRATRGFRPPGRRPRIDVGDGRLATKAIAGRPADTSLTCPTGGCGLPGCLGLPSA